MKTTIFQSAIKNRRKLRFLYDLQEVIMEPYFISINKKGSKVLYGRVSNSNEIVKFEYNKIINIKTLDLNRFSPIIPILSA